MTTIIRNRANAYTKAIGEVLPNAIQIADCFHLHQNLLEAVRKIIRKKIPVTTTIASETISIPMESSFEKRSFKKI